MPSASSFVNFPRVLHNAWFVRNGVFTIGRAHVEVFGAQDADT